MTTDPLVSIIIPCFNAHRFIGDAIRSGLDQTYPNTEVILIDDGSTDKSLDVIRLFEGRVRWESGPNRGGGAARNRGLQIARGEYIQFLDADDRLLPSKLQREVEQLQLSNADVCLAPYEVISTDGHVTKRGPSSAPAGDPFQWLLFADARITPLYRSNVIALAGGFDASLPCCQDLDLTLRIALTQARYTYLDQIGYQCRRQAASVSSDEIRLYRVMVQLLGTIARERLAGGTNDEARRQAVATKISTCARWLLRFGDTQHAMNGFRTAAEVHHSGGLNQAYSVPALWLRHLVGPLSAEHFLWRLRRVRNGWPTGPLASSHRS